MCGKAGKVWHMAGRLLEGTSKNPDADESAESFPSYFTKFLRIAPTTRAKFCLIWRKIFSRLVQHRIIRGVRVSLWISFSSTFCLKSCIGFLYNGVELSSWVFVAWCVVLTQICTLPIIIKKWSNTKHSDEKKKMSQCILILHFLSIFVIICSWGNLDI